MNLEWTNLTADTHIYECSSEASSTQNKVRHIGGATRNTKGHVSHWSCWETKEGKVTGLDWKFIVKLRFICTEMSFCATMHVIYTSFIQRFNALAFDKINSEHELEKVLNIFDHFCGCFI